MAIKRKSEYLHIRVPPGLREQFAVICEDKGLTLSEGIRRFMQHQVDLAQSQSRYRNVAQRVEKIE
jgi:antitoxin component of RelBE/YafQ-DinJ toxin-antitoxin module